jgi:peroxidase
MPTPTSRRHERRRSLPASRTAALLAFAGLVGSVQAQLLVPAIDGTANNPFFPHWGATHEPLLRLCPVDYADGISLPGGVGRPGPREVSNAIATQTVPMPASNGASSYLWQWGQFIDHDMDLSETDAGLPLPIGVPAGDIDFDPFNTGTQVIPMSRSVGHPDLLGVRQQENAITAFIDGSNVYGSDQVRADTLRGARGTLKMDAQGLLPVNSFGLPNDPGPTGNPLTAFVAGDIRANEQTGLLVMHTLFAREHNRITQPLGATFLPDDFIYEYGRLLVSAQIQAITYNEFLPLLVGPKGLRGYRGWRPFVNPTIANEFSTAAFRLGHTLLPSDLLRVHADLSQGAPLPLRDAFFNPDLVRNEGIDVFLRGLVFQPSQELDNELVDDVRNFLFGDPGSGGLDLASLNIQRGREHGLRSLSETRTAIGLSPINTFADISSNPAIQAQLASVYNDAREVDLWIGGLCEDRLPGSMLGETFQAIVVDQFERLRDGDRFFYARRLPFFVRAWVHNRRLSDVLRDNTGIGNEIPDDVFRTP